MRTYDPGVIEPKWQERWEAEGLFRADDRDDVRPRFYNLQMFPYPSGDLHMGHAEAFAISEAIGLYRRMQGHNVLNPIGWDAFGLPAENAAINRGARSPKEWTYANIAQQASTLRRYGCAFDWSRRLNTCDPEYYKWTQWLFLVLHERGLAERKLAPVNWCPHDQTVLANEQVINGRCERCDTPVVRRDLTQWFFTITKYADRLLEDMSHLSEWPERVLVQQRNWIGRSEGAEVEFQVAETGEPVTVFTTRPDTLWGVTFFVFAPEHPMVMGLAEVGGTADAVRELRERMQPGTAAAWDQGASREGVALGVSVVNPVNGERVPCFVAPYVLMEYGTGAIMGVPFHDQRDFEFAREHRLDVRIVIQPDDVEGVELEPASMTEAWSGEGMMVNSGPFDGRRTPESIPDVIAWLEEQGRGRRAVSYRLRDWLISRQRYWGAPIPIIHCPTCGEVPVPLSDLPVLLPDDVDFSPTGESPLAKHEGFVNVSCPRCGGAAKRETDTMDTFVDSSWYFLRFASPWSDDVAFEREAVDRWLPVGQYTGGVEHAILHLLYSRFIVKVLYDAGLIGFVEPFTRLLNQGMVINEGAALSKSRGNVVEPLPLIERFGADTIRVTMLFAGPVEEDIDWATVSPDGVHRWLRRLHRLAWDASSVAPATSGGTPLRKRTHRTIRRVTTDMERFKFNTAVSKLMTLTNEAAQAVDGGDRAGAREAAEAIARMVAPVAPHMAEELWREAFGHRESVFVAGWPSFDADLAREESVTLVVQVDGRVRDRLEVSPETGEDEAQRRALASAKVAPFLDGRRVARVIVRPPRLVNIVTAP